MNHQPLMQQVLGPGWNRLARVIRAHYSIASESAEEIEIEGEMFVDFPKILTPLFKLIHFFGGLLDLAGGPIRVSVRKYSKPAQHELFWHRVFVYPEGQRRVFRSRMEYLREQELIEFVNPYLGLRLLTSEQDGELVYRSRGHILAIGALRFIIPDWLGLGHATIIERAVSESEFELDFRIRHPLLGNTFSYRGKFQLPRAETVPLPGQALCA